MPRRKTGRPRGRPYGSLTTARTDLQLFGSLHRTQGRIWRRRQQRLQRLIEGLPDEAEIPENLMKELMLIDQFLGKSSGAMVHVLEATDRALQELPTEQLEAQLAAELVAAAGTWTDAQWALVEHAQRKRNQELERTTS